MNVINQKYAKEIEDVSEVIVNQHQLGNPLALLMQAIVPVPIQLSSLTHYSESFLGFMK